MKGASILKQCIVLPLKGPKYYLMYTFMAVHVLVILDPGTSLATTNYKIVCLVHRTREDVHRTLVPPAKREVMPRQIGIRTQDNK